MKRRSAYRWCGYFSLPLLAGPALSNSLNVDLSAMSSFTDNANLSYSDAISERQDEYSANLIADYTNSLIDFDTDYRASENHFDKGSQEDRSLLEGNANLLIGKPHQVMNLLLSHSRRSLLSSPDQVNLLENQDERNISSAIPTLRMRLSSVDNILLQGEVSKIGYRYSDELDSERKGGNLIWQHRFSDIDKFEVSAQHAEISYDSIPGSNVEYQNASIAYSTKLRQLSYLVSLGYNTSKPETGEDFSSPAYRVEVNYQSGFNTLSAYINQQITDTSQGDGNRGSISDPNIADTAGMGLDQFESQIAEIRWQNQSLCGRCNAYISLLYQQDNYQVLNEDNSQNLVGVGLNYKFSTSSNLDIRFSRSEHSYAEGVAHEDYTEKMVRIEYRYIFVNDLSLSVFVARNESDSEAEGLAYEENVSGLSLSYRF